MENIVIGKNAVTNADMILTLPTVAVISGKKMAGKTFLIRKIIERKTGGRMVLITDKPDSYHGLGENFVSLTKNNAKIEFSDQLTIFDAREIYEDDPEHILDDEIKRFASTLQEDDLVVIDEAYPYLNDEANIEELLKTIEEAWKRGATIIIATNRVKLMNEKAPRLLQMCEYSICMKQDQDTAERFCELSADERGKYELLQVIRLMEFGTALVCRQDGTINFINVG